ncbi:MAG TPA: trypsin-like peptidase domain-containing protein [Acidimicrobiales bacterium]|nr:trypsin-like peptidase domain-containing protein [Acidimicrobiales bacterium]
MRSRVWLGAVGAIGVVVVAVVLASCSSPKHVGSATVVKGTPTTSSSGTPALVRKVQPFVVTIFAGQGVGSGVVTSADGLIVTNAHVVGSAQQVQVGFADGQRVSGTVKASDEATDLAVVQANRNRLTAAKFQTNLPEVGQAVIAVGSPLGFQNTVTGGIISGLLRSIPGSASEGHHPLVDLIQTDAAISPGNSGGALVDEHGDVVGINVAYIPPSQGAVSLGFAIPAATAIEVSNQLITNGRASHASLGIIPATLTQELARKLGDPSTSGAVILDVTAGGAAGQAGLAPGDIIVDLGGQSVSSAEDLASRLRHRQPGDRVTVTVSRRGRRQDFPVTLGSS